MLTIGKYVTPSPEQWEIVIEGMRNPKNSWDRMDTEINVDFGFPIIDVGENDMKLMKSLASHGTEHRKYARMLPIHIMITAPLYWWKEFDTYRVGTVPSDTVENSCSTMHKISAKKFELDDFSCEELNNNSIATLMRTIDDLNYNRKQFVEMKRKTDWWQMIQLLPSSYNQMRLVEINYEVAMNILRQRRNHKLTEWHTFCDFLEELPYMKEFV